MDKLLEPLLAPLRPHLTPYTTSLPPPLATFLTSYFVGSTHCYTTLVEQLSPDPTCLTFALSKTLGLGIVLTAAIVKLPQLLKIVAARSGAGLSFLSIALETFALVVAAAYNFRQGNPFSTYGEGVLIAAQNAAIGAAVLGFGQGAGKGGQQPAAGVWVAVLAVLAGSLTREEVVPTEWMARLMAGAGVLGVASKLPQIWTIWREGGTGQLSAFTVFNYLIGSLARIFTTLKEVNDPLILWGFVAGFALNAVLAAQMVYYWRAPASGESVDRQVNREAKALKGHVAAAAARSEKASPGIGEDSGAAQKVKSPSTRRRA